MTLVSSLVFVQAVFGQNILRDTIDTLHPAQTSVITESSVISIESASDITALSAEQPEETSAQTILTPVPPTPSPAQETTAAVTSAAEIQVTAAATTAVKAAATIKPVKQSAAAAQTSSAAAAAEATTPATAPAATAATTAATTAAAQCSGTYDSSKAREVFDLVNQQRSANNLPALSWNDSLASTAKVRAQEISVCWSHTRPNGSDCFSAFSGEFSSVAENIACGQTSASSVMDMWMASASHKENILRTCVTQLGVSCYYVNGTYYWVQDFGG